MRSQPPALRHAILFARAVRAPFARAMAPAWVGAVAALIFLEKVIHVGLVRAELAEQSPARAALWAWALGVAAALPLARRAGPALYSEATAFLRRQPLGARSWSQATSPWALALAAPVALLSLLWPSDAQAAQAAAVGLAAAPALLAGAGAAGLRAWLWVAALALPWGATLLLSRQALFQQGGAWAWAAVALAVAFNALALGPAADVVARPQGGASLRGSLPRPRSPIGALLGLDLRRLARQAPSELLSLLPLGALSALPVLGLRLRGWSAEAQTLALALGLGFCALASAGLLARIMSTSALPPAAWPVSIRGRALSLAALTALLQAPAFTAGAAARLWGGLELAALAAVLGALALVASLGLGCLAIFTPGARGAARPINLGVAAWWALLALAAHLVHPALSLATAGLAGGLLVWRLRRLDGARRAGEGASP